MTEIPNKNESNEIACNRRTRKLKYSHIRGGRGRDYICF